MAKKKTNTPNKKKQVNTDNVIGLHSEVTAQPITETLETNYMPYAMSTNVSRAFPRDRRLQTLAPQAALHHVQDGPAQGRAPEERQHRGSDHEAQPARRRRHLRDDGAPRHGQRGAARAVRGVQGQLWQVLLGRPDLRRLALHRGQALPHLRRDLQGHRQGPGRLRGQLRRRHEGAAPAAHHVPQHPGVGQQGHRRGHGLRHLRLQPQRGLYRHHALPRGPQL